MCFTTKVHLYICKSAKKDTSSNIIITGRTICISDEFVDIYAGSFISMYICQQVKLIDYD
jgi:hypothetical protein